VYDVGEHEGSPYIVSELLEGETLRERLTGTMPQRRSLEFALQIAHGLAAAHEKGIVHRDLKPENVIVGPDGRVKILDFGLATFAGPPLTAKSGDVPTVAIETEPGLVMGTVGYMSPEQVRGEPADHRSDIFAFGAILYEVLSGRRAFAGPTHAETLTAILREQPADMTGVTPPIPSGLSRIVDRCLEKNAAARFQSAHDLAFALEQLMAQSGSATFVIASRRRSSRWLPWALLAAVTLGWAATWMARRDAGREGTGQPPVRFQIQAPGPVSFTGSGNYIAVSPDGSRIVLVAARASGPQMLWLQPLDALTAAPMPDTERATQPFWSPDGRYVGFFADGRLKRIAASGGPAQPLCDAVPELVTGSTWGSGGTILFSSFGGPILKVSAPGDRPAPASQLDASDASEAHMYPQFLPDGRRFLYYRRSTDPEKNGIYVHSLDSAMPRLVARASSRFVLVPDYLVYARDGLLLAHPFDPDTATTTGEPIATGDRIEQFPDTGNLVFSGSSSGVLAYRDSSQLAVSRLVWRDREGREIGSVGEPNTYRNPRLSPDGRHIAVELIDRSGNRDIWILDAERGTASRFTFDPGRDASPVWSKDGRRIAWQGNTRVLVKDVPGGREEVLHDQPWIPDDWLAQDTGLLYHPSQPRRIWLLPLTGPDRAPQPVIEGRSVTSHARVSPDGRWIAFASGESGGFQVYVQSFPSGAVRTAVSIEGGIQPKWSHDGRELLFLGLNRMLMAVPLTLSEGAVQAGRPQPLFDTKIEPTTGSYWHQYDVSADGKRLLVNAPVVTDAAVTVVVNWPALVQQRQ
jgi:Tol biopolymer transport system component